MRVSVRALPLLPSAPTAGIMEDILHFRPAALQPAPVKLSCSRSLDYAMRLNGMLQRDGSDVAEESAK